MSNTTESFQDTYDSLMPQGLEDYLTLLRFPTIGADPAYDEAATECVQWLEQQMRALGLTTTRWETSQHPILFGEKRSKEPDAPTLLLYNHYDVQPIDPLEEWSSPPFSPTIVDEKVIARGAQDNKGQLMTTLLALRLLEKEEIHLPLHIKWLIDGDEETGSAGLSQILQERKGPLQADYLLVVDGGIEQINRPSVTLGMRGIITMDISVRGPSHDLHSGVFGGMVENPLHLLAKLLCALHDEQGRVTVPGFYDRVRPLTEEERQEIDFHFDEEQFRNDTGVPPGGGEQHYPPLERAWVRPTLEINGIYGGYGGAGFKTVIPGEAHAKVSCRLVPDQDPEEIGERVADFLRRNAPQEVEVEVQIHPGKGRALRTRADGALVQAVSKGYEAVFGSPCSRCLGGGSIPVMADLASAASAEVLLMGVGLAEDAIHSPNESFSLDRLKLGTLTIAHSLCNLRS